MNKPIHQMNQVAASQPLSVRFGVLTCGIVLLTAVSAMTFFGRQERMDLEKRLQEKSTFINSFYSYLIADALMRKDDVTLLQVANRLEQDEEIASVVVVDQTDEVRYHTDPHKMGMILDDAMVKRVLTTGEAIMVSYANSGGKALGIVSPLKVQGSARPIGVVRIDLTYRRIDNQVKKSRSRYWFIVLGSLISCIGFSMACVAKWITTPLDRIRNTFTNINAALPESNLPETSDDFGKVHAAINDLVFRFKNEGQQQSSTQQSRGEQEKVWVQQLAKSLFPGARLIVADKDNRIISDSGNGSRPPAGKPHLMDLITDTNFANLLNTAFQKEGESVRGPVTFQDKSYGASILSVPLQQSVIVKTLIALQPN